jgi:predicted transcriptional regulator
MPNLEDILKKTKAKSEQIKFIHKPTSIATTDRPYLLEDLSPQGRDIKYSESPIKEQIKTDNKVVTNRQQTDNKVATKWQQTDNKVVTKWQQTDNKVVTKCLFSELVGLQRNIIIFMSHECKNLRARTTDRMTLEHLAKSLNRSTGVVKMTIHRLEKKGFLFRSEFKNGRGGWSRYELPDYVYNDALRSETDNKLVTNWQQTDNKVVTQPITQPITNLSSSSSYLNKTTTTELGEDWNFDISSYARFGFTTSQIKQLASLNVISAAEVEQSLVEFNYDFENNVLPIIKTGKINFLMGLLRSGHLYVSEGFKSEQEAIISEMARRAEARRKKLLEDKFLAWVADLSDSTKKEILVKLPTSLMVLEKSYGISNKEVKSWYFNYFVHNVEG